MNKKTLIQSLSLVGGLVLLDQLTKLWIIRTIPHGSDGFLVIENVLRITHHHNYGALWGHLQGQILFFILVTLVALVMFIYFAKDGDFGEKPFYTWGISLLIGGTLGNFIDRLRFGYVVDFIDTYIFGYNFPIFNVADMALTVGMALFAFDILVLEPMRLKRQSDE